MQSRLLSHINIKRTVALWNALFSNDADGISYFSQICKPDEIKIAQLLCHLLSQEPSVAVTETLNRHRFNDDRKPLMYIAAEAKDLTLVKQLIRHGVHVNAKTIGGFTAFTLAYANQDEQIVRTLMAAGAVNPSTFRDYLNVLPSPLNEQSRAGNTSLRPRAKL